MNTIEFSEFQNDKIKGLLEKHVYPDWLSVLHPDNDRMLHETFSFIQDWPEYKALSIANEKMAKLFSKVNYHRTCLVLKAGESKLQCVARKHPDKSEKECMALIDTLEFVTEIEYQNSKEEVERANRDLSEVIAECAGIELYSKLADIPVTKLQDNWDVLQGLYELAYTDNTPDIGELPVNQVVTMENKVLEKPIELPSDIFRLPPSEPRYRLFPIGQSKEEQKRIINAQIDTQESRFKPASGEATLSGTIEFEGNRKDWLKEKREEFFNCREREGQRSLRDLLEDTNGYRHPWTLDFFFDVAKSPLIEPVTQNKFEQLEIQKPASDWFNEFFQTQPEPREAELLHYAISKGRDGFTKGEALTALNMTNDAFHSARTGLKEKSNFSNDVVCHDTNLKKYYITPEILSLIE